MIIFRYFAKEIVITLLALTTILMLIFLSNQFVHYLMRAASGSLPSAILFQLMMLEIPNLLALLLPLGLYVAILIGYGRMYAESEMTVLQACGFSQNKLIAMTMTIALVLAIIVGAMMLWLSPIISADRDRLITSTSPAVLLKSLLPGRFQTFNSGRRVLYATDINQSTGMASNVFMAQQDKKSKQWSVLTAKQAHLAEKTGDAFVVLDHGQEYTGVPGQKDFRVVNFGQYRERLPKAKPVIRKRERAMTFKQLWPLNNKDPRKAAELQWRFSIPIMVLLLALLAIPLSKVDPRQGKFAKMLPAILIFIVYANFLFVVRGWVANGKIPTWLGMWWLHGVVLMLALILLGWPKLKRMWA